MNKYENYVREQFKKLKSTKYGFNIKIVDGENNSTNYMELTPQKIQLILKLLNEHKKVTTKVSSYQALESGGYNEAIKINMKGGI
jgi:type II restriction/modification system DNA methylase subunit YeeA